MSSRQLWAPQLSLQRRLAPQPAAELPLARPPALAGIASAVDKTWHAPSATPLTSVPSHHTHTAIASTIARVRVLRSHCTPLHLHSTRRCRCLSTALHRRNAGTAGLCVCANLASRWYSRGLRRACSLAAWQGKFAPIPSGPRPPFAPRVDWGPPAAVGGGLLRSRLLRRGGLDPWAALPRRRRRGRGSTLGRPSSPGRVS